MTYPLYPSRALGDCKGLPFKPELDLALTDLHDAIETTHTDFHSLEDVMERNVRCSSYNGLRL